jgi:hypothetical protein
LWDLVDDFYQIKDVPFYSHLSEHFNEKLLLNFCQMCSLSICSHVAFFLFYVNMVICPYCFLKFFIPVINILIMLPLYISLTTVWKHIIRDFGFILMGDFRPKVSVCCFYLVLATVMLVSKNCVEKGCWLLLFSNKPLCRIGHFSFLSSYITSQPGVYLSG